MSAKTWNAWAGLFSSPRNWTPDGAPAAGDSLYIQSGTAIMANQTFGSDSTLSTISFAAPLGSDTPKLVMLNVTLRNVRIDESPAPSADQTLNVSYRGSILIAGSVTNDGGTIEAGRGNIPRGSLDITIAPGSTLINKGTIYSSPGAEMTLSGSDGSTLENDRIINAAGGSLIISTHLTGTGDVYASRGQMRAPHLELKEAVDAGQTFHLFEAVLQIDQPASFLGQIDESLQQSGLVELKGLTAASWDINGSSIEFFDAADSVIDTLRFHHAAGPYLAGGLQQSRSDLRQQYRGRRQPLLQPASGHTAPAVSQRSSLIPGAYAMTGFASLARLAKPLATAEAANCRHARRCLRVAAYTRNSHPARALHQQRSNPVSRSMLLNAGHVINPPHQPTATHAASASLDATAAALNRIPLTPASMSGTSR